MEHFNFTTRKTFNPLENVTSVRIASGTCSNSIDNLRKVLNRAENVKAVKVQEEWSILYPANILAEVVLVKWLAPCRGVMQFKFGVIHFRVDEDTMVCW